ncbi:MAG TPA: hypothetical protein VGO31_10660 [Microbacteriaceae bacterium]|jgi:hypothetical protein|nr:hypothetical protein [Microbacteriaceae bacterium]
MEISRNGVLQRSNDGEREFDQLEEIVAQGLSTFIEVGHALLEIQIRRLYLKAGFRTFAAYVTERWDISEAHAYRQIEAAKVIDILSPIGGTVLPANEAQARELVPLANDPDAIRSVWSQTVAATGNRVTARAIRERVTNRIGHPASPARSRRAAVEQACPECGHRWVESVERCRPGAFVAVSNEQTPSQTCI